MKEFKVSVLEKPFGRKVGELSPITALDGGTAEIIAKAMSGKLILQVNEIVPELEKPKKKKEPKAKKEDKIEPRDWLLKDSEPKITDGEKKTKWKKIK